MNGDIKLNKVKGTDNLADALTKYVSNAEINFHSKGVRLIHCSGRHPLMPHVDG